MIEVKGVTKSYGALQVLKGIDLTIKKNEIVSIVGASGAAKVPCFTLWGPWTGADAGTLLINDNNMAALRNSAGAVP